MKLTKRSLTMVIAIVLCAVTAIGGTFAYLTDTTAEAENVFTVGNVKITQHETFDPSNAVLYPGNVVTKEVKVENTGFTPAYVRTLVSFEMGKMSEEDFVKYINWSYNSADWNQGTPYVEVLTEPVGKKPAGSYYVVPFIYKGKLSSGNTTSASLQKVWLSDNAGSEQLEALTDENNQYSIFVLSQAVQTDNFDSATEALNAAFGSGSSEELTIKEFNASIKNAGEASSGDVTIHLVKNATYNMSGFEGLIKVDGYNGAGVVTINGNGATLTNMSAPLFAGGFAGESGIVIKDLTIADSKFEDSQNEYNETGYGAFICSIDSMPTITLKNCHLVNSTVSGSRTGGLIGWNSGYNNQNDGPVKTIVTIEDCTVKNCEITGNGTVGGIVGHAGANAWTWNNISNCTVSNTKLTSNDDSYRVGAIVGTANVGEVTITNCTSSGNTFLQNNAGTGIERPNGQSELYGRFVPQNGSGSLTIDGTAITQ